MLASNRCESDTNLSKVALSPLAFLIRSITVLRSPRLRAINVSVISWSSVVLALMKRAAAAEMSPEMDESRIESAITGTCCPANCRSTSSMAENDKSAVAAATTVRPATIPKATCSLALMPNRDDV